MTLIEFEPIFRNDIAPIYINHQKTFDVHCIHGCLHIARSLVISNYLSYTLKQIGKETNKEEIFYAVAFHDSGRIDNGIDYWETQSRNNCYNYLSSKNTEHALSISNMIFKDGNPNNMSYLCVYDADVIEIARPCTGIGFGGFDRKYLKLTNIIGGYYTDIINECFGLIRETELEKWQYSDDKALIRLITYIEHNKEKYSHIYESLHEIA